MKKVIIAVAAATVGAVVGYTNHKRSRESKNLQLRHKNLKIY